MERKNYIVSGPLLDYTNAVVDTVKHTERLVEEHSMLSKLFWGVHGGLIDSFELAS